MKGKRTLLLIMTVWASADALAQGTLGVSEILFQPYSGEAEYVELYNSGSAPVELADYHIVRWVGDTLGKHYPLPSHTVAAHDYVVLTKDAASVTGNYTVKYLDKVVECKLPTYPNGGGSVILMTADSALVDRLDYTPSMHSRLLRDKAGVSLERRSFERPTHEASNWFSAASTAGYGTPSYENSQSTEYLAEESAFEYSADLLSPDGDGYQDELEITYRLDNGELSARIDIYNASGLPVRRLLNNALLGTHGSLVWDGRDEKGKVLPCGQYLVQIILYNLEGQRQTIRRVVSIITY